MHNLPFYELHEQIAATLKQANKPQERLDEANDRIKHLESLMQKMSDNISQMAKKANSPPASKKLTIPKPNFGLMSPRSKSLEKILIKSTENLQNVKYNNPQPHMTEINSLADCVLERNRNINCYGPNHEVNYLGPISRPKMLRTPPMGNKLLKSKTAAATPEIRNSRNKNMVPAHRDQPNKIRRKNNTKYSKNSTPNKLFSAGSDSEQDPQTLSKSISHLFKTPFSPFNLSGKKSTGAKLTSRAGNLPDTSNISSDDCRNSNCSLCSIISNMKGSEMEISCRPKGCAWVYLCLLPV